VLDISVVFVELMTPKRKSPETELHNGRTFDMKAYADRKDQLPAAGISCRSFSHSLGEFQSRLLLLLHHHHHHHIIIIIIISINAGILAAPAGVS